MAETKVGIEHFGYADGISQPMYLADEVNSQSESRIWDDQTNLNMVLVEEKDGVENCFGSYFVFRKLEQNVAGFKDAEGDNGDTPGKILIKIDGKLEEVKDNNGLPNKELAGAMIVGRFENSTPVTKVSVDKNNPADPDPDSKHLDNDFDYAHDKAGSKCPFHAHIRLMNPRSGVTDANPHADPEEIRSHRITRRAIPYDDHTVTYNPALPVDERKRFPEELIDNSELLEKDNQPTGKVGLLFMCYQSNIKTQFEELQGQWANTGEIDPLKDSIGQDSLITQSVQNEKSQRSLPVRWGEKEQSDKFNFSGFVTMRGGEYFYTPSICFLKNL